MRKILLLFGFILCLGACSTVDCPFQAKELCYYSLRGPVDTLSDTLTITTEGSDSILLNQSVNTDSFGLPMSFSRSEDVLIFHTGHLIDTVVVEKTNEPHFESVDCGVAYFHTITGIRHTRHALDSIVINNNRVNYNESPANIFLYFKEYRL